MTRFATILAELSDPDAVVDNVRHDHNVFQLATLADCYSPDAADSPGALFLAGIARDVADHCNQYAGTPEDGDDWPLIVAELTDGDAAHYIADSAVPIYTHERWAVFTDLGAYNEDVTGIGATADDLTGCAGVALYMIAERLVRALAEELSDALDEDEDDEDEIGGMFTDLGTGQKAYVTTDGAGRFHLTWSNGIEIGHGFDTFTEAEAAFVNRDA